MDSIEVKKTKSKNEIWDIIHFFVNEYFTDAYGIMVTGSFVTEFFNKSSDIDIIILSGLFRKIYIDTYDYHGVKIQAIVFPVFDLNSVIKRDIENGGIYLNQIYKGQIIKDRNNLFRDFKMYSDAIYEHGPNSITKYTIDQGRAKITTRLEDLEGNDNYEDNLYVILDLYPKIIDLYFKINQQWSFAGKAASRFLRKQDPSFLSSLSISLKDYIKNGNKVQVINFVKNFLQSIGGELHYFTTRENCKIDNTNSLVLFISSNYSNTMYAAFEKIANKAKTFITNHVENVEMFAYFYPDRRVYKSGLYLIFYAEKEKIENEILPLVEAFHFDLNNSQYRGFAQNFYYPYINNPLDIFGDEEVQKNIIHFINKLKSQSYEEKNIYVYYILKKILNLPFFCNKETKLSFWKFCYDILESSDNSLYLSNQIKKYYYDNKLLINEKRYLEIAYKLNSDNINELRWVEAYIKEIANLYDTDIRYITKFSLEGLSNDPYLKNHVGFCIYMINFIEVILNTFIINNNEKLFVIFAILKYIKNE